MAQFYVEIVINCSGDQEPEDTVEEGEEIDEANAREAVRLQHSGSGNNIAEVPVADQQNTKLSNKDQSQIEDSQPSQGIVTRSGRTVRMIPWRKDYV